MNIQLTIGSVNFTDWLHITVVRVRDNELVWEDWFDMPVSSLVVQATGLDADHYYIRMYDSPDDSSLGLLKAEAAVSGLSAQYQYELRFYTIGTLPGTASLNGAGTILTDTYLIGKTIHSVEKSGYGKYDPADEYSFTNLTGAIEILNGSALSSGEKFCVVIQNNVGGAVSAAPSGFYTGTVTHTAATVSLTSTDKNKQVRMKGSGTTQVFTLPALSGFSEGEGFYFDNSVNGTPVCPKILTAGSDRIKFGGFSSVLNSLSEIWLTAGEYMLVKKNATDGVWEIVITNMNVNVGASFYHQKSILPFAIPGNGRVSQIAADGDVYGRLWWWLTNLLDTPYFIIDNGVNSSSYVHPAGQEYKWVRHSTLKQFRPPNTQPDAPTGKFDMYYI